MHSRTKQVMKKKEQLGTERTVEHGLIHPLSKVLCCVVCDNASQLFSILWISPEKLEIPHLG